MVKQNWFTHEKDNFFKEKKKVKSKNNDFNTGKALKTVGGLALLGVGIHLATELID